MLIPSKGTFTGSLSIHTAKNKLGIFTIKNIVRPYVYTASIIKNTLFFELVLLTYIATTYT
jgi:hypothetical protein